MLKIGLTGGIGSGKSTVSNILKEEGIPLIDVDIIAREVMELYPEIIEAIKLEFGEAFIDEEGKLKRRVLGDYVFKAEERRKKLESITIPFIIKELFIRFDKYDKINTEICVADVPTLIEHNLQRFMDYNVLVWVDDETQLARVMNRDSISKEAALDRIHAQMPLEQKKAYVDFIINNNESIECTKRQVLEVLSQITRI